MAMGTGVVQVAKGHQIHHVIHLLSRKVVIMKACSYKRGKSRVRTIIIIVVIIIIIISIIIKLLEKKRFEWMEVIQL